MLSVVSIPIGPFDAAQSLDASILLSDILCCP